MNAPFSCMYPQKYIKRVKVFNKGYILENEGLNNVLQ